MTRPLELACYAAGSPVSGATERLTVTNPFNGEVVGSVLLASARDVEAAISAALDFAAPLDRFGRYQVLEKTRLLLEGQSEQFARVMTAESGLCLRETRYEVGRTMEVLRLAAMEALRDDSQVFSCDISAQGKARKIFTLREPLRAAVAITPFNHPLNQVAHKVCPAVAAGTPLILKPSEKTPLTAIRFAELLYQAGLPPAMLSVLLGPTDVVASPLVKDDRIPLVTFTGSVAVGKMIASTAGYKKVVLELGGNDPFIIMEDADLSLAIHLAAEGSYRNSGQRCTAVKRIFVHRSLYKPFAEGLAQLTRDYICGDPSDEDTRVGTVIDERAAIYLEEVLSDALQRGAKLLTGGKRRSALFEPTVVIDVPPECKMVASESFGPLAPVMPFDSIEEAIALANSTSFGLSSGVITNRLDYAVRCVKELRCGAVNINEVPGFRVENSPFGGIKDSGLGIKEGVIEAIKCFSYIKTYSLPW